MSKLLIGVVLGLALSSFTNGPVLRVDIEGIGCAEISGPAKWDVLEQLDYPTDWSENVY